MWFFSSFLLSPPLMFLLEEVLVLFQVWWWLSRAGKSITVTFPFLLWIDRHAHIQERDASFYQENINFILFNTIPFHSCPFYRNFETLVLSLLLKVTRVPDECNHHHLHHPLSLVSLAGHHFLTHSLAFLLRYRYRSSSLTFRSHLLYFYLKLPQVKGQDRLRNMNREGLRRENMTLDEEKRNNLPLKVGSGSFLFLFFRQRSCCPAEKTRFDCRLLINRRVWCNIT